jgi:small conductance mechanosensitive channel
MTAEIWNILLGNGWQIVLILSLWVVCSYGATRFGRQVVTLILRKEKAGIRQRRRNLTANEEHHIDTLSSFISRFIRLSITLVFGSMVLTQFGISVTPLFASAGVIGVALGFGAQTLIKDILAGLFVLLENQYAKGDRVKLGEITGMVEDLSLRATILRDDQGVVHYIPNGAISVISNFSKQNQEQHL